jgi:hypothetical protein
MAKGKMGVSTLFGGKDSSSKRRNKSSNTYKGPSASNSNGNVNKPKPEPADNVSPAVSKKKSQRGIGIGLSFGTSPSALLASQKRVIMFVHDDSGMAAPQAPSSSPTKTVDTSFESTDGDSESEAARHAQLEQQTMQQKIRQSMKQKLVVYYKTVKPEKNTNDALETILKVYDGRYDVLDEKLAAKYNNAAFLTGKEVRQYRHLQDSINQVEAVEYNNKVTITGTVAEGPPKPTSAPSAPQPQPMARVNTTPFAVDAMRFLKYVKANSSNNADNDDNASTVYTNNKYDDTDDASTVNTKYEDDETTTEYTSESATTGTINGSSTTDKSKGDASEKEDRDLPDYIKDAVLERHESFLSTVDSSDSDDEDDDVRTLGSEYTDDTSKSNVSASYNMTKAKARAAALEEEEDCLDKVYNLTTLTKLDKLVHLSSL